MTKKHLLSISSILLIVGSLAFYGGIQYANASKNASKGVTGNSQAQGGQFAQGQRNRQGGGQFGRIQGGGAMVNGEILSVDTQSVTVKLPAGGSKIAFYSASTKISKTVDGTIDDLKVGENLVLNGQDNPDGSMTAQTIQLRTKPVADPNTKAAPGTATPKTTK